MKAKHLVLILVLAATAITAGYAMQRPSHDDAVPAAAAEAVEVVVITAKRHVADHHR